MSDDDVSFLLRTGQSFPFLFYFNNMWERQRADPVQFLQTPEFVRFPRGIKLRNGIYNGELKMRGPYLLFMSLVSPVPRSALWNPRSRAKRDADSYNEMLRWGSSLLDWNECQRHFVPFTPSPKHLPGLGCLPSLVPCDHSQSQWPPSLLRPAGRRRCDVVAHDLFCHWSSWKVFTLGHTLKGATRLKASIFPFAAKVYIPTVSSNELAANPAMKLCVRDSCKPKINVGCVNKKLVNGVEEAPCPPRCPLCAG